MQAAQQPDSEYEEACKKCKQVPDSTYHRIFAVGVAVFAIIIMVLIWFTGMVFQIVNFVIAFLVFALGVAIVIVPVRCKRCDCR